jgi:hypothetical protein
MRASAPVMAKSPNSGNAWLTTQSFKTGLGCAASAVSPNHSPSLKIPLPYRLHRGVAHEFALSNLLLVLNYSPEA